MTLAEKALEIAISQLGVQEVPRGSNRGPQVDEYIKSIGLDPAGKHAWCVAFGYWCYEQAAEKMGRTNPMAKIASVHGQWNKRKDKFRVQSPQPGDLLFYDHGNGKGHFCFIERVDDINFYTVDGNSNDEGIREGVEVCRLVRPRNKGKLLGILRFA